MTTGDDDDGDMMTARGDKVGDGVGIVTLCLAANLLTKQENSQRDQLLGRWRRLSRRTR